MQTQSWGGRQSFPTPAGTGRTGGTHTHTAGTREQRAWERWEHGEEPVVNEPCGTQIKAQVCGLRNVLWHSEDQTPNPWGKEEHVEAPAQSHPLHPTHQCQAAPQWNILLLEGICLHSGQIKGFCCLGAAPSSQPTPISPPNWFFFYASHL